MSIQPYAGYHKEIQLQQQLLPFLVLHFDPETGDLQAWFWPITETGTRVAPPDLMHHRALYDFKLPSCLCASDFSIEPQYTECAVYLASNGKYGGEYVAGCAFDRCGYIISMNRMYTRRGLLLERYPGRDARHPAPPIVRFVAANKRCSIDDDGLFATIPTYERPESAENTLDWLLKLDAWSNPGLTEAAFRKLFARCCCGLVTTRRVFKDHVCAVPAPVLTVDDSDRCSNSGSIIGLGDPSNDN